MIHTGLSRPPIIALREHQHSFLFNDFVYASGQAGRHDKAERFCGPEIDQHLVGAWNGKSPDFLLRDAIDVSCCAAPFIDLIRPIAQQAARGCKTPERIDCG